MSWHVTVMGETRNTYKILVGRSEASEEKTTHGRFRHIWKGNAKISLKDAVRAVCGIDSSGSG